MFESNWIYYSENKLHLGRAIGILIGVCFPNMIVSNPRVWELNQMGYRPAIKPFYKPAVKGAIMVETNKKIVNKLKTKKMKTNIWILFIGLLIMGVSCSDDDNETTVTDLDISSEAVMDDNFEEVDNVVEAGMTIENAAGRVAVADDEIVSCATVTRDPENKMVTVDFGESCEGLGGRIRSGKIIISYTDRRYVPGASRTVTFENFSIDGVIMEGIRTMTNVSDTEGDFPKFNITLIGGKLTFRDGTIATREADRTRTWMRASNPINDESTMEGTSSGVDREGVAYSSVITTALLYKRSCRASGTFIAVQGVRDVTKGERAVSIDYGDGTCDNIITISEGGRSVDVDITKDNG